MLPRATLSFFCLALVLAAAGILKHASACAILFLSLSICLGMAYENAIFRLNNYA